MDEKTNLFGHRCEKAVCAPLPVDAGGLAVAAAQALLGDEAVLQLVLDAKGMQRGGLILRTGVLLEERMGQCCLSSQSIHGVKRQDTFQKVHS